MAAVPGPVGAYNNINDPLGTWDPGTTQIQAYALWNSQTGTANKCSKVFYNEGVFPTVPNPQLAAMVQLGVPAILCYKPRFDTTANMAADLVSFTTSVNALQAAGVTGYAVLWQEPQNSPNPPFPTGTQYVTLMQFDPNGTGIGGFHAAANAAGFKLYYDAASHTPSKWSTYFPGGAFLDGVSVDYYYSTYATGTVIHGAGSIMALADGANLPFGVFEIGLTAGGTAHVPTQAQMASYMDYLVQIMGWNPAAGGLPAGRLNQGKANGPVMWFNGAFHQSINQIVPVANATANIAAWLTQTAYPNLYQALQPQTPPPALQVTTTSLPSGTQGAAYSAPLAATGGTTPYTWSLQSGSLPTGLTLHAGTGVIDGTPTGTGTSSFTVKVTDSATPAPATATQPLSITVSTVPAGVTPAIPGRGQPGTFTPGLQGAFQPLNPLSTTAIPGMATPGTFSPADPGTTSLPPPGTGLYPAVPAQAEPGMITPGDPGEAIPAPSGEPFIAQQVSGSFTYNYGWSATEFTSSIPGGMLVVIAAWDLNATGTTAPMPAAYVCDSALNYWYHAGTTSAGNTGSRCAIWVAPNARAVDWVSCSLTTFASSLVYTILEVGNAPQFFTIDAAAVNSGTGNLTLAADPGLTGAADIGFTMLAAGSTTTTLELPPAGWTALGEVQAGTGQPNGITLWPFWNPVIDAGTSVSASYTVSASAPLSAVTVTIETSPYPPVQRNTNLPGVTVEAAFGFLPGDPSQPPPAWTDITSRCAAKEGTPFISAAMGRSYELATPETGELVISCDNHDGAFTPGNGASPYAPGTGVMLGTPVRVSAYWEGSWYNIAFGYVERWPQEWPDMPQWGMSAMIAADAFSALAAAVSYSALDGDMLLDAPYALIPCFEQYTTQANSLNTVVIPSECQGLLAANISRTSQRPGTYVDGSGAQCATGQSTTLLGSQDTGFGCSSFTAPLTPTSSGPGMIYWDPALPSPLSPAGLTVEFWPSITAASAAANTQPVIFTAFSAASNYQTANPSLQIQVQNFTGNNILAVTFADGTTMTAPFSPSPNPQQVALVFSPSTVSLYINGALATSQALAASQAGTWNAVMLGCGNYAYHNGTLAGGVFTASNLGIYPYQLPLQRIVSHYVTGVSGQQGVAATTRIAQVLAWSALGIPRGGRVTFNGAADGVGQGPAYSLSGASVSGTLNQIVANHQAMAFTSPDGTLQYMHRWALFNQAPALVFGDGEDLGEIPYLPGQAFDYDNTYLYNIDQVTQTQGPTTGITVTATSTASEAAYFNRSILQIGIQTTSNLDAYDIANWVSAVYSQPQLRLRGLTVDAAANPQVAFPGVLALQQGNAAVVNRRPVGGVPLSANVIVQKIAHNIGPGMWQTSYEMSPYPPLNAVLQLDAPGFDVIGTNSLP